MTDQASAALLLLVLLDQYSEYVGYKPGSDKGADFAIKYIDKVNRFLKQQVDEKCTFEETLQQLKALFR